MRIGILSMQRIVNYGSYMQSLALKELCESLGHTVEFVDFHVNMTIYERQSLADRMKAYRRLAKRSAIGQAAKHILKKNVVNPPLLQQYYLDALGELGITSKKNYETNYDVLIIGSDEVFNCTQTNVDVGYSLELFGKGSRAKKTITYAASFGTTTLEKIQKYGIGKDLQKYLMRLDAISVRDENSMQVIEALTYKTPLIHLDPVLVGNLDAKEDTIKVEYENYLLVYGYSGRFSDEEGEVIQKFAHGKGLKTISISGKQKFCDICISCRPKEILSYYRKADYIVTDTFHGTIFSIITHKKFATICRKTEERGASNYEKLEDLLIRLGLSIRELDNIESLAEVIEPEIDYTRIETLRVIERERTLEYLRANLD